MIQAYKVILRMLRRKNVSNLALANKAGTTIENIKKFRAGDVDAIGSMEKAKLIDFLQRL